MIDSDVLRNAQALLVRDLVRFRMVRMFTVASPTVGTEWSTTVPGGSIWEILSVRAQFATSAVVANRTPAIRIRDPDSNVSAGFGGSATFAASTSRPISWFNGAGAVNTVQEHAALFSSPAPIALASWTVSSVTGSLDVGDQYSAISLTVREWSEWAINWFTQYVGEQLANVSD